ncbi:MAG: glycosyltransferase family 9 protein [Thiofilum sp.]|uniref:glycosyltransferase family 9 protein n=1 Tax=Thiofilum sp. TaxID=2212733 RepID=UPI0025D2C671|nr:glycosyltransferase family 9 protein [Thiofilum sp.]MBK8451880.1 glycosyltransferase family 9 protein [Thiofilum sp.]
MLSPLLKALRNQYPEAQIDFLCPPYIVPLYSSKPYGVNAYGFDLRSWRNLLNLIISSKGYDLGYIPGDNRWSWLAVSLKTRWVIALKGDQAWKNWMVNELVEWPTISKAWGDITTSLVTQKTICYEASDWPIPVYESFSYPQEPYVVLHIGASKPHKYWRADYWNEIAQWLRTQGFIVAWSIGQNEKQLLKEINIKELDILYDGSLTLAQFWVLLKNAKLLIAPDTGIAHLGRIVNTPTIALFGPGSPKIFGAGLFWQNSPYVALWEESVACRNQSLLFNRDISWVKQCWRSEHECSQPFCTNLIKPEQVKYSISEMINL